MTKEVFGRGIQMLNSVIPENKNIIGEKLDVYFYILQRYSEEAYLKAVEDMLENHPLEYNAPSTATILKYIKKYEKTDNEIFNKIKEDVLIFGPRKPKYNQKIMAAIENAGGWSAFLAMTEESEQKIKEDFLKAYNKAELLYKNDRNLPSITENR